MLRRHRYYKPKRKIIHPQSPSKQQPKKPVNTSVVSMIVGSIFFTAALAWFAYFFLGSDNFKIKTVEISGNENIPMHELREIVDNHLNQKKFIFLSNNNIIITSMSGVVQAIREQYIVDDIKITRKLPFTLSIALEEKLARVVLRTKTPIQTIELDDDQEEDGEEGGIIAGEQVSHNNVTEEEPEEEGEMQYTREHYYLDVNGIVVVGKVSDDDLSSLPTIEIITTSQTKINPGDIILNREIIEFIFALFEETARSQEQIKLAHVLYDPDILDELKFITTEGWQAFVSMQISIETQIKKLELALQDKIKSQRSTLQYVDLRIKDRVYFK
tara:strand:+ start:769 stop:1755 length:987 start_codon:yes stop_codon:yes gene_type:complete